MHKHFSTRAEHWLILAGFAVGLTVLTRFASISFLASISLFLLISARSDPIRHTARRLGLFVLPALILPIAWAILKFAFDSGASAPRELEYHPITLAKLLQLFDVVAEWLFIDQSVLAFSVLLALVAHIGYSRFKAGSLTFPLFLISNGCLYVVFVVVSVSFFDAATPIDQRIMLPVLYLALLFVLDATRSWLDRANSRPTRLEAGAFVVLFVFAGGAATLAAGLENYRHGFGFMSRSMQDLELHEVVKSADFRTIYTNAPELVKLHVGRRAILLPYLYEPSSQIANDDWIQEVSAVLQEVDEGRAGIVYYNAVNWRPYLPSPEFFKEQYDLEPGYSTHEGAVYQRPLR